MTSSTAAYIKVIKELALTKANNIYSPDFYGAVKNSSGERYIKKSKRVYKSFCKVSREPETGCLQEMRIP